ncbi:MAG: hypothetical protein AAF950_17520 [Pseudomonadota bacterium]
MQTSQIRIKIQEEEVVLFEYILKYAEKSLVKSALQNLCLDLENNRHLSGEHRKRIVTSIFFAKDDTDVRIRRWIYKLIALLKIDEFIDDVSSKIILSEEDEENLTWAIAALCGIADSSSVKKVLHKAKNRSLKTFYQLPALLYSNSNIQIDRRAKIIKDVENRPLAAKWLSLLFGYNRNSVEIFLEYEPKDVVRTFNKHDNSEVAEYSIWALFKSRHGRIGDCCLCLDDIQTYPSNMRRWLYRLMSKDASSFSQCREYLIEAIDKEGEILTAREGLALGLGKAADSELADKIVSWFWSEQTDTVRIALLPYIFSQSEVHDDCQDIARDVLTSEENEILAKAAAAELSRVPMTALPQLKQSANILKSDKTFGVGTHLILAPEATLVDRSVRITAGGDINASDMALNVGEIRSSVVSKIGSLQAELAPTQEIQEFIDALTATSELEDPEKGKVLQKLDSILADLHQKKGEEAESALERIGGIASSLARKLPSATKLVENANKLVDALGKFIS